MAKIKKIKTLPKPKEFKVSDSNTRITGKTSIYKYKRGVRMC